jgi:hypothetical protein
MMLGADPLGPRYTPSLWGQPPCRLPPAQAHYGIWVLPVHRYEGLEPLLASMAEKVIAPAEAKVKALHDRRQAIEAELTKPS